MVILAVTQMFLKFQHHRNSLCNRKLQSESISSDKSPNDVYNLFLSRIRNKVEKLLHCIIYREGIKEIRFPKTYSNI